MVSILENIAPQEIMDILAEVSDPEVPVLSVLDLGVIRKVDIDGKEVHIKLTPTYSGCPAMDSISDDLRMAFKSHGYNAIIEMVLAPAWSSDWLSEDGKRKLEEYGIAVPLSEDLDKRALLDGESIVPCPQCKSTNSKMISQFGSTACKALFQCKDCLEPFDYFKCLK